MYYLVVGTIDGEKGVALIHETFWRRKLKLKEYAKFTKGFIETVPPERLMNECELIGEYTSYKTAHSYFEDAAKIS